MKEGERGTVGYLVVMRSVRRITNRSARPDGREVFKKANGRYSVTRNAFFFFLFFFVRGETGAARHVLREGKIYMQKRWLPLASFGHESGCRNVALFAYSLRLCVRVRACEGLF